MILFPNAKINLGLNITRHRADGYHDLESIFIPVGWKDVLEIVPAKGLCTTLTTFGKPVNCPPEANLVMRAYKALDSIIPLPPVDIFLEKIIPDGAGLGGGSADAAFTLKALNEMFALGLDKPMLASIAGKIGADCAFFIYNRPMLATGIGTSLSPIDVDLSSYYIIIVKPDVSISTREAYSGVTPHPWNVPLTSLIASKQLDAIVNDFEQSIFKLHPELDKIKHQMIEMGAVYASMSGSGSAIYGLYANESIALSASASLAHYGEIYSCKL